MAALASLAVLKWKVPFPFLSGQCSGSGQPSPAHGAAQYEKGLASFKRAVEMIRSKEIAVEGLVRHVMTIDHIHARSSWPSPQQAARPQCSAAPRPRSSSQ